MITGGVIVLGAREPAPRALPAVATPLIGIVAWRFAHLVMPISRRVQAAKGDVTESADEAVVGIEMVQAFGREADVASGSARKAGAVRNIVVQQAGVEANHLPASSTCPRCRSRPWSSSAAATSSRVVSPSASSCCSTRSCCS